MANAVIKQTLKSVLYQVFPEFGAYLSALRFRKLCKERFWAFQTKIAGKLYDDKAIKVLSGPFCGTRYFNEVVWGLITPKWLGSYESELHSVVSEVASRKYKTLIDVGAAEGYYAVGLANLNPNMKVYTFDTDPYARKLQNKLAKSNGVSTISIGKHCSHKDLEQLISGKTIVICDIEGWEHDLLSPHLATSLVYCDLLVEVHRFKTMTIHEVMRTLIQRFAHTHTISTTYSETRNPEVWRDICNGRLTDKELSDALNEHRSEQQIWLWMKALSTSR